MPRLPRVYIEGILYYVTSKGGHNQDIFVDPEDYKDYVALINKYKIQYGFNLFSYALLPTHLHMLIELKNNIGISNIMHDINSLYTKNFNSRYGKKGHLFQERFKATLAEKESHLVQLTRHTHLNAVRNNLTNDPKDYPHSSYTKYLDPSKRRYPDMNAEVEEVFKALKGREQALENYTTRTDQKEIDDFRKLLHKKRILGSKEFSENVKKAIEEKAKEQKTKPSKKAQIVYMMISGVALLVLTITIGYFYKQNTALKSSYDKTRISYQKTLEMLRRERDRALKADQDAEKYLWKIRLTERALEELRREKEAAGRKDTTIDGYAWRIRLGQLEGGEHTSFESDIIYFEEGQMNSVGLRQLGFATSSYKTRKAENGKVAWEATLVKKDGQTANFRGEWDGRTMKGILSRLLADGTVKDYSFLASGLRIRRGE